MCIDLCLHNNFDGGQCHHQGQHDLGWGGDIQGEGVQELIAIPSRNIKAGFLGFFIF